MAPGPMPGMSGAIGSILLALAIASCQVAPTARPPAQHPSAKDATAGAVTPAARATNGAKPSPRPGLAKASLLQVRAGNGRVLSGTVQIDASYLVSSGHGSLLQHRGTLSVAAGLISDAGALAKKGAGIISDAGALVNGAGIISDAGAMVDGSGIISDAGALADGQLAKASLVSDAGSQALATDDGTTIATSRGYVVAPASIIAHGEADAAGNNGGAAASKKFRLLASSGAALPSIGNMLPAAGMVVFVRSLATGLPIPIGNDPQGNPAYAIYTNLDGKYQAYLPDGMTDNVEVVAQVPHQTDVHLVYGNLVTSAGNQVPIDEDTALALRYIHLAAAERLLPLVQANQDAMANSLGLDHYPPELSAVLSIALTEFIAAAQQGHTADLPADKQLALAERLAELELAGADLVHAQPLGDDLQPYPRPADVKESGCLPALVEVLKYDREAARQRMLAIAARGQHPADVFSSLQEVQRASAQDHETYRIERPSDVDDFILHAYFTHSDVNRESVSVERDAFMSQAGLVKGAGGWPWVDAIATGVIEQMALTLINGGKGGLGANAQTVLELLSHGGP